MEFVTSLKSLGSKSIGISSVALFIVYLFPELILYISSKKLSSKIAEELSISTL